MTLTLAIGIGAMVRMFAYSSCFAWPTAVAPEPEVRTVGPSHRTLLGGTVGEPVTPLGPDEERSADGKTASLTREIGRHAVGEGYFRALGMDLLRGRAHERPAGRVARQPSATALSRSKKRFAQGEAFSIFFGSIVARREKAWAPLR